jgi:cystathionine beta-synthase
MLAPISPQPRYAASALDAVGGTPLVRLNRIIANKQPLVLAKLEYLNPGGSIKDRIALALIAEGERSGKLRRGGTIVEPTSGNTGAALAMAAAVRGYRCILTVPEKTSSEKIAVLRAYGAEVVVAPPVPANSPEAYTALAARIARELPGAFMPDQYHNPANPRAHERWTGVEIWEQTRGCVTHVVAGMGTGGTICGIARALKGRSAAITIVGVDPVGSIYSGGMPEPYAVEGIGRHYLPATLDLGVIDRIERVSDRDAFAMARRAAREEGILAGGSAGATLVAATRITATLGEDAVVVVILPDSGHAYLSKIFNDTWLTARNVIGIRSTTLRDIVLTRPTVTADAFVPASATLRHAARIMRAACAEELAVIDGGRSVGSVSSATLLAALRSGEAPHLDVPLTERMGPPLPTLDECACVDEALEKFRFGHPRIVVTRDGVPHATLNAHDILSATT